jgi:hypothetical protein
MALIETEEAAGRLARVIVSDIEIYNRQKIAAGGDLSRELEEGYSLFQSRVVPALLPLFESVLSDRGLLAGKLPPALANAAARYANLREGAAPTRTESVAKPVEARAETPPAPIAEPVVAPPESAPAAAAPAATDDAATTAAKRLARVIVSDIVLYNNKKIAAGEDLRHEIEEGRALFKARVAPEHRELLEALLVERGLVRGAAPARRPTPAGAPVRKPTPQEAAPVRKPTPAEAAPIRRPTPAEAAPVRKPTPAEAAPVRRPTPQEAAPRQPLPLDNPVRRPTPQDTRQPLALDTPVRRPTPPASAPVRRPTPWDPAAIRKPTPSDAAISDLPSVSAVPVAVPPADTIEMATPVVEVSPPARELPLPGLPAHDALTPVVEPLAAVLALPRPGAPLATPSPALPDAYASAAAEAKANGDVTPNPAGDWDPGASGRSRGRPLPPPIPAQARPLAPARAESPRHTPGPTTDDIMTSALELPVAPAPAPEPSPLAAALESLKPMPAPARTAPAAPALVDAPAPDTVLAPLRPAANAQSLQGKRSKTRLMVASVALLAAAAITYYLLSFWPSH